MHNLHHNNTRAARTIAIMSTNQNSGATNELKHEQTPTIAKYPKVNKPDLKDNKQEEDTTHKRNMTASKDNRQKQQTTSKHNKQT